jgi:hypothetical protein
MHSFWNSVDELSKLIFALRWGSTIIVAALGGTIIAFTIHKNNLQKEAERIKDMQIAQAREAAAEANSTAQQAILNRERLSRKVLNLRFALKWSIKPA